MPKKFRNYVIKGQEHVDRKAGKTIPSTSAWRSVRDMLPEAPTDDTACLYYVKLKNSERIIMLAYTGNGEWTDTEGKEYKGIETWLEYMPKEHQIVERKAFLNEDILKAIVSDYWKVFTELMHMYEDENVNPKLLYKLKMLLRKCKK